MPPDHAHSPTLSSAAESDMVGYSRVSPAAIVALLLGLASFFAVGNLLLLVLPALAIVAAAMALAQIARSDGSVSGRWAAIVGLVLALLFASTSISRSATRAWHLRSEARTFADAWLELVRRGDLQQAHQWHLPVEQRQSSSTRLAQFYHDSPTASEQFKNFSEAPPLSRIVAAGRQAKLRYLRVDEQLVLEDRDRIALLYEFETVSDAGSEKLPLVVLTERTPNARTGGGSWQIAGIVEPQKDALTP